MYYIVWTHGFSVRYTESSEMDRKPVGSGNECTIIFSNCQFFAWMKRWKDEKKLFYKMISKTFGGYTLITNESCKITYTVASCIFGVNC